MRLAVVTASSPYPEHSVRAANVVVFELTRALAQISGLQVALLQVNRSNDPPHGPEEEAGRAALAALGVTMLPAITLPAGGKHGNALSKLIAPKPEHFYPDVVHRQRIADALAAWNTDALMVPWSEWLTPVCAEIPVLRFAYYGNPDPKTALHRAALDRRLGGSLAKYVRMRVGIASLERVHLDIMRNYQHLGDVAANDAEYYRGAGHPHAFYIRNIWIDRFGESWRARRDALEQLDPLVIIGNVGKLNGTANRYGLEYLGREVLPALRRRMPSGSYRVEILGAGKLDPQIGRLLDGPDVVHRGFVEDIDEAMLKAPIFLCVNNASPFKVGHTRYLHAWTLGSCVIAHRDAALSMPEMVDGQNALLGADAEQIVDRIETTALDRTGKLLLFVVVRPGAKLDRDLIEKINDRLRAEISPRHLPDAIYAVPEIPHTLNGKRLEVPVKRILMGTPPEKAVSREAMANPGALRWFIDFSKTFNQGTSKTS